MKRKQIVYFTSVVLALFFLSGCTNTINAVTGSSNVSKTNQLTVKVAGVKDIEIPYSMEPVTDETMAINNQNFKGGIYLYKGRVDVASLRNFINGSMANNQWVKEGESTIQKHSLLVFTKQGRSCIVLLSDDLTNTKAQFVISSGKHVQTGANNYPPSN